MDWTSSRRSSWLLYQVCLTTSCIFSFSMPYAWGKCSPQLWVGVCGQTLKPLPYVRWISVIFRVSNLSQTSIAHFRPLQLVHGSNTWPQLTRNSLRSNCFLSFSWRRDQTSKQATERAWVEQKTGEKWGGGGEKRLPLLASLPCSLFFSFARSFVPWACFFEMPATQANQKWLWFLTSNFISATYFPMLMRKKLSFLLKQNTQSRARVKNNLFQTKMVWSKFMPIFRPKQQQKKTPFGAAHTWGSRLQHRKSQFPSGKCLTSEKCGVTVYCVRQFWRNSPIG